MPWDFHSTQYDVPFRASRLCNYEVPKNVRTKGMPEKGVTLPISNHRGHLLDKTKKSAKGARSGFVSTWDMPLKVPGPRSTTATARKKEVADKLVKENKHFKCQMEVKSRKLPGVRKVKGCDDEVKKAEEEEKKKVEEAKTTNKGEEVERKNEATAKADVAQAEPSEGLAPAVCDEECQRARKIEECKEQRKREAEEGEQEAKCDVQELHAKCREMREGQREEEKVKVCEEKKRFESCVQKCTASKGDEDCGQKKTSVCDEKLKKWTCDKGEEREKVC